MKLIFAKSDIAFLTGNTYSPSDAYDEARFHRNFSQGITSGIILAAIPGLPLILIGAIAAPALFAFPVIMAGLGLCP